MRNKTIPGIFVRMRTGIFLFPFIFSSCFATDQDILALNRQIQSLSAQLRKLEAVREKQADVGAEIDNIKQDVQRLSGEMEENQYLAKHAVERDTLQQDALKARLNSLENKVTQLYRHLNLEPQAESQIQAQEAGRIQGWEVTQQPSAALQPGITPRPPVEEEVPASPDQALYERTLASYQEGKYNDAVGGFKDLIKKYPTSSMADNAQFWIGEAYMAQKKYELAIQAYNEVITKYPNGNKVPNAMFKQAMAFIEVKDTVAAKIILKNLIKKYPSSDEARLADERLKVLK